jgi:hypothetical protein
VRAAAGIDAAVTARHHIAVRKFFDDGSRFTVDPTLAGLERLSQRLAAVPAPVTAVVEPTSITWLALALAVEQAGSQMKLIGARHSARLAEPPWGRTNPTHQLLSLHSRRGDLRPAGPAPSLTATGTGGAPVAGAVGLSPCMDCVRRLRADSPCRAGPLATPPIPGIGARCEPDSRGHRTCPWGRRHTRPRCGDQGRGPGMDGFWEGHLDLVPGRRRHQEPD